MQSRPAQLTVPGARRTLPPLYPVVPHLLGPRHHRPACLARGSGAAPVAGRRGRRAVLRVAVRACGGTCGGACGDDSDWRTPLGALAGKPWSGAGLQVKGKLGKAFKANSNTKPKNQKKAGQRVRVCQHALLMLA